MSPLLDRYLTAVKFWLPKSQRDDIAAELAANLQSEIDDRAANLGRPLDDAELAALLKQHGPPILVASRYRGEHRTVNFGPQLIGPIVFPFYWIALKISLVLLLVPGILSAVFLQGDGRTISEFAHALGRIARLSLPALLVVTAIFALIDLNLRRFHLLEKWGDRWDPRSLPPADRQQKQVRRSSSIAGIIFQSLFILWWMRHSSIPVLLITKAGNQIHFAPVLASLHFPILVVAFICLAQHWINLVEPGWRWLPPLSGMITSLAGLVILYPLLTNPELVAITDQNGVPMSKGGMAGLHHMFSTALMSVWFGILIVGIVYAWRLVWIAWQSMPPRPPAAPNGNGVPLV
jgi:hypothetical protein